jgi:eukaryotic-like serine/threonine-protein kinase
MHKHLLSTARYSLITALGRGGMGSVHLGIATARPGFQRLVTMKRVHAHLAEDETIRSLIAEEARLGAAIHHPNVVSTLDVVQSRLGLTLIQEYVDGIALGALVAAAENATLPIEVGLAICADVLRGLAATHAARDDQGEPLEITHRDLSPENVLVGLDGVARVIDFGIARAASRSKTPSSIPPHLLCGKIAYMAPEQLLFEPVTGQADVYAVGVVLWELLAGRRYIEPGSNHERAAAVLAGGREPPSTHRADVPSELDAVVMRALASAPSDRYPSALEFERALAPFARADGTVVGALVSELASDELDRRRKAIADHAANAERASRSFEPTFFLGRRGSPVAMMAVVAVLAIVLALLSLATVEARVANATEARPTPRRPGLDERATDTRREDPDAEAPPSASAAPRASWPPPVPRARFAPRRFVAAGPPPRPVDPFRRR